MSRTHDEAPELASLFGGLQVTGELAHDVPRFLHLHGKAGVARHVRLVAETAGRLADRAGVRASDAAAAGWLHDITLVMPYPAMVEPLRRLGVPILQEELAAPQLLHGKLSAVVAEQYAGVTNTAVLDAIRRHTTLCGNPTALDKVLFIADKLSWSPSDAPYHQGLVVAVEESIDHAVAFFLAWSWQQRYPVVHPWLREAYEAFC